MSVIIASYRPGDAVHRVIDSLDAQTLPQDQFEVIFVDDGSPDDTVARLQQFASTRPNMRVFRIENSGWPSRPRNVGIEHARGEYVMFMDHDDSLYPDGLRRAYEYAKETDADLLTPKESKTDDSWWALGNWADGNVANALTERGIERVMPMNPHKLYRRQIVVGNGIRFPEGRRALWEDWYINIGVYRHSKVVSVLADTPVYLWHTHDTNTSRTFDPAREEYWERLEDVIDYITATLDGPDYRQARASAIALNFRTRIIDGMVLLLNRAVPDVAEMAFGRARRMLARYASDDVFALLPRKHQAQAYLLRAGRPELMKAFLAVDLRQRSQAQVRSLAWRDGMLVAELECVWEPKRPDAPILRRAGARIVRVVGPELERAIPPELLDVTRAAGELHLDLIVRSRQDYVSWYVPFTMQEAEYQPDDTGAVRLVGRGEAALDIETGAVGAPLADDVWDFKVRTTWTGMTRKPAPRYTGPALPVLRNGRGAVAYANSSQGLSLDLAQRLRVLAMDAKPRSGPAGAIEGFSVPLENVAVFGTTTLDAGTLVAVPNGWVAQDLPDQEADELLEKLAVDGELGARVVADAGGARFEGSASLAPGRYTIYARLDGKLRRTKCTVVVDDDRQARFG